MKDDPPEMVAGDDGRSAASRSGRQVARLARAAGLIADAVIIVARPNAPTLEIGRIVAERCRRAGLPVPSHRSLTARIAYVRKHGTPDAAAFAHQITIDHCVLIDARGGCATLAAAILEPPGVAVAWMLDGRPYDAGMTAALIADALAAEDDDGEPARLSAVFATDPHHAVIDAALAEAGATRIGGSIDRPAAGHTVRRVLGTHLTGIRARSRIPGGAAWADHVGIDAMWLRVQAGLSHRHARSRVARRFVLAGSHRVPTLAATLRRIADTVSCAGHPGTATGK